MLLVVFQLKFIFVRFSEFDATLLVLRYNFEKEDNFLDSITNFLFLYEGLESHRLRDPQRCAGNFLFIFDLVVGSPLVFLLFLAD